MGARQRRRQVVVGGGGAFCRAFGCERRCAQACSVGTGQRGSETSSALTHRLLRNRDPEIRELARGDSTRSKIQLRFPLSMRRSGASPTSSCRSRTSAPSPPLARDRSTRSEACSSRKTRKSRRSRSALWLEEMRPDHGRGRGRSRAPSRTKNGRGRRSERRPLF